MFDTPRGKSKFEVIISNFFDGTVFNSRKDNKIVSKCVYSVLEINMEGQKEILDTRRAKI